MVVTPLDKGPVLDHEPATVPTLEPVDVPTARNALVILVSTVPERICGSRGRNSVIGGDVGFDLSDITVE